MGPLGPERLAMTDAQRNRMLDLMTKRDARANRHLIVVESDELIELLKLRIAEMAGEVILKQWRALKNERDMEHD